MEDRNLTSEELQELETLREEKRRREQTQRAEKALDASDIPLSFAALLAGRDDTETDGRVKAFCETYQQTLSQDIRKRLPTEPTVMHIPTIARIRRGIVRIR